MMREDCFASGKETSAVGLNGVEVIYFEGRFVPAEEARISVMSHVVQYGTGCFEGIRGYRSALGDDVLLFRVPEHLERFQQSCRILGFELALSTEELCALTLELVRRNGYRCDLYVRPLAYVDSCNLLPVCVGASLAVALIAAPIGGFGEQREGVRCGVSSWRRSAESALPPRAKITGGYANIVLAANEGVRQGFDETIMLTPDGTVAEASGSNLFLVRDGVLVTPGVSECLLEGVTRGTLLTLGRAELGLAVQERSVARSELYSADEVFLCGTGFEMMPVVEVDHRRVGTGRPGRVTRELQTLYFRAVRGALEPYAPWVRSVYGGVSEVGEKGSACCCEGAKGAGRL